MVNPKIVGSMHPSSGEFIKITDSKTSPLVYKLPLITVLLILSLVI